MSYWSGDMKLCPTQKYHVPLGVHQMYICRPMQALMAYRQGGVFIMPHLLLHGISVYAASTDRPHHLHVVVYYVIHTWFIQSSIILFQL
jgi:hypothetical protein